MGGVVAIRWGRDSPLSPLPAQGQAAAAPPAGGSRGWGSAGFAATGRECGDRGVGGPSEGLGVVDGMVVAWIPACAGMTEGGAGDEGGGRGNEGGGRAGGVMEGGAGVMEGGGNDGGGRRGGRRRAGGRAGSLAAVACAVSSWPSSSRSSPHWLRVVAIPANLTRRRICLRTSRCSRGGCPLRVRETDAAIRPLVNDSREGCRSGESGTVSG